MSMTSEGLRITRPAPVVLDWWAVQSRQGGLWITYKRLLSEEKALALARLVAREWTSLGPWRVAHCAETVVWASDAPEAAPK